MITRIERSRVLVWCLRPRDRLYRLSPMLLVMVLTLSYVACDGSECAKRKVATLQMILRVLLHLYSILITFLAC